jgi:hypothetical protein
MHCILGGSKKAHPIRIVGPPPRLPGQPSDPRSFNNDPAKPRKVSNLSFSNRAEKMVCFFGSK